MFFFKKKVNQKHPYFLPVTGISNGEHEFSFLLGKQFFEIFDESLYNDGKIDVEIKMKKMTDSLFLTFALKGYVITECDRCLDKFNHPLSYNAELTVKFGPENSDLSDADDSITLSTKETVIDLTKHLYDYVNLSLPIRKIHPKDEHGKSTCNPEMIKKIKQHKVKETPQETDPRWEDLKKLLN